MLTLRFAFVVEEVELYMPPKKAETPIVQEIPDQPPTFDNDAFMEDMLNKARTREVDAVEEGVALALRTEDYKINLRNGVLVDFHVEIVLFCSQQGFPPRKTAAFIKWMDELRRSVVSTGSDTDARRLFKEHLVSHAERSTKDASGVADPSSPAGDDGSPSPPQISAPKLPPTAPKKGEAKKAGKGQAADVDAASRPTVDSNVYLAVADMGAVADFVVAGLLQHWRLYHYVATEGDAGDDRQSIHLSIQVPMKAPPLHRFMTQEQYETQCEDARQKAEAELERRQKEEVAALEAERLERERIQREK